MSAFMRCPRCRRGEVGYYDPDTDSGDSMICDWCHGTGILHADETPLTWPEMEARSQRRALALRRWGQITGYGTPPSELGPPMEAPF